MIGKSYIKKRNYCYILSFIFIFNIFTIIFIPNISINAKNNERLIDDLNSKIQISSSDPPNKQFFEYYKTITIDYNKVNGTEDLKNFPVLISFFDSDLHDHVYQPNGTDIAFANKTAWLDHEIELFDQTYNSTHAQLIAWVRIPNLHSTKFTEIDMYYGNSTMGPQENPENVWDSNFKGVWHLSEDPSDSPPQMKDSTSNNNHGTTSNSNLDTNDQENGQIDGSIDFDDNGDNDHIDCGNDTSLNMGSGEFSLSMWFNYDGVSWGAIAGKGAVLQGKRYYLSFNTPAGQIRGEIDDDSAPVNPNIVSGANYGDNKWHHLVMVRDEYYLRLYIDGNEDGTRSVTGYGNIDSIHPFYMNAICGDNGGQIVSWSSVKLDEVRVSNTARSKDWIATEYNNQYDPGSFYSIGKEERVFVHPHTAHYFKYYKIITIDHNKINGTEDLKNFPVLISILDSDLHDHVNQSNGNDIAFSEGISWLDHEIELFNQKYNQTHAMLVAWVRIPSLSPFIDTNITMYFGNNTIGSQQNPNGVWTTDYKAVWHLSENQTGVGYNNLYKDSTLNSNHGDDYITATGKEGQIDGGQEFNGEDDYIDVSDIGSFTNLTISAWIKPKDWGQVDEDYIHQIIGDEDLVLSGGTFSFRIGSQGLESYKQRLGLGININSNWSDFESLSNLTLNMWQYVVVTFDGNDIIFYIDGNKDNTQSNPGIITNTAYEWVIGYIKKNYFRCFDGNIDELRIADAPFTADWIATEYNNQFNPLSFFSISSKEKLDNTPPLYSNLIESSDPLELGETEVITINVFDTSGINQVKIEIIGSNHSMTNIGGDTWQYDSWTPSSVDNYTYTIWMEDNGDNWNSTIGIIEVRDTTSPTYSDLIESSNPLQIGQNVTITIKVYDTLGSGVNQVLLEYDSSNHTMVFIGGDTWSWNKWKPAVGNHPYKIFMQDMENNWNLASGTITVVDITPPNINTFLIIVIILASVIASVIAIVLVRRKLKKDIAPPREKIPLKVIISHINKLSSVELALQTDKIQKITGEKEIEMHLNEIKSLGEELFAEGAYLEAQEQFKMGRDLLINLGREEDAELFSELISGIQGLIEERERRLELLEQVKIEGDSVQLFELYNEIIDISKRLRDPDTASFYQSELIQFFQINKLNLIDLEDYRHILEQKADSLLANNQFEIAAQIYRKCEIISQIFIQLERDEEVTNFEKFRNKKTECLNRIKEKNSRFN